MRAIITDTFLGREDHGILTFSLGLYISGVHKEFGGFALDSFDFATKTRSYNPKGLEAIAHVLDTVGVATWDQLTGKEIRIKNTDHGPIYEIGHVSEERWFNLKNFFSTR